MVDFDTLINRKDTFSAKWDRFGDDVLPLWVADMDFASPPEVTASMRKRLEHPIFGYESAHPEVIESICAWLAARHNWTVEPDDIVLMSGVVSGFNWVIRTLVDKDESVLFQTPVYHPFFQVGNNNGVNQNTIPLAYSHGRYAIEVDAFQKSNLGNTRLFLLCNPHNPIGRVFSKDELKSLGEYCLANNILICSDEIHSDLVYPENRHIPIASLSPELEQSTVTLMAPSKTFNIPGLQFAYAITKNKELRKSLEAGRNGVIERPNILAYYAADAAYRHGGEWLDALIRYLDGNRKFIQKFIQEEMPKIEFQTPEGTYLAWLDCKGLDLPASPFEFFLENAKVALNDGKMFQGNGASFVRLNFACPRKRLSEALEKMAAALKNR